jgi:uncharacterized membrane protein
MKTKIIILALLLLAIISLAGIDEMQQRQEGMEPTYSNTGVGNGQGGGLENNPNVPVDDLLWVLIGAVATYGIIKLTRKEN